VVMWLVGTATVTTQGLTARYDTTNEEWGLLSGQNWGLRLGHQWGLFHGHGHPDRRSLSGRRLPLPSGQPYTPLQHPIGEAADNGAYEDSLAFTRPAFPSPATPGWNESGFGFHPGLRTPRSPTTHAKAGTVLRTLDRITPSSIEPPIGVTTHNVRPHVARLPPASPP